MTIINNVMNNHHCWYQLNLDTTNSIRNDFKLNFSKKAIHYFDNPTKIFNQHWLDYMKNNYLEVDAIMMFYKPPRLIGKTAHDDGKITTFGINWLLCGVDSEMIWFDFPKTSTKLQFTEADTPYYLWPVTELTEIDRCGDNSKPILVRVDNPHTINVGIQPRISISVRTKIDYSWENIVEYFRSRNLLIERTAVAGPEGIEPPSPSS